MEWEHLIIFLYNESVSAGLHPTRLVVNNLTYALITSEFRHKMRFSKKDYFIGLKIYIDRNERDQNKILIEVDSL